MQQAKKRGPNALVVLLLLTLALAPIFVIGCGGDEEEPAAKEAVPAEDASASKDEAPAEAAEPVAAAPAAVGDVVPVTLDVLGLMPETATAAVALPPLSGLFDKGVALAKRVVPPEQDVDAFIALLIEDAASDAGVPDAKSFEEIAVAKGLDINSPIAVFADLASAAAASKQALESMGQAMANSPEAGSASTDAGDGSPEAGSASTDADAQGMAGPTGDQMEAVLEEMEVPDLVGVLGCVDTELAVASLKGLLVEGSVDLSQMEEIDAKGVMISFNQDAPFGYFTSGNLLVVGNSLTLLQGTAARLDAPTPIRYGSTECPASQPDEIVALARADKLMPLLKDLLPALTAMNPQMAPMAEMQMATMDEYLKAMTGDDPLVMTIAWTDELIELLSRLDTGKHTGLRELMGKITPLRLAPMLPGGTLLMLAQQFNEKTKEQIQKAWGEAMPQQMQAAPEMAGVSEIVGKVVKAIDDEIVIGLSDSGAGIPHLLVMASLTDAEETKALIQTFSPLTDFETHNDVPIQALAASPMFPVYLCFPGNVLLLSNDAGQIKQVMDMLASGAKSPYFASLTPPLDTSVPRQNAVSISTKLLSDVVVPLAGMFGQMPPEAADPIETICGVLREMRMLNELQGDWTVSSLSLYLNPPA